MRNLMKYPFIISIFTMLCLMPPSPSAHAAEKPSNYIDVHMHLDGVSKNSNTAKGPQNRRGKRGPGSASGSGRDYLPSAEILVSTMDQYAVRKAIVMPPPQGPDQQGSYSYEDLLPAVRAYPDRLVLGAGGGTLNPMIVGTDPGKVTPEKKMEFEEQAERIIKDGAKVFGEMTAMHLCMNPKHHYVAAPPDHPLFLLLADIAARNDIPIDLHMEAVEKDMPTPKSLLDACSKNPAVIPATLDAFERLLSHNPRAKIVWQHIGWDNTGQMTPALISRLLSKHRNLYMAVKSVPVGKGPARQNRIHDDNHKILPEWQALFEKFPDRFVAGADEFINAGSGYRKPPFFRETWTTIETLPRGLADKVGGENAGKVYGM